MRNFIFSTLGILFLLVPISETSTRCKGFDQGCYTFHVPSLEVGQILGKVNFNCSGQKAVIFETDDSHFQVDSNGRISVTEPLFQKNQASFFVTAYNEAEEQWDAIIRVLTNGEKLKSSADDKSKNVPIIRFPHSSGSSLRRKKREWVIPAMSHSENSMGPFPEFIVKIASSRQKEITVHYFISGPGADQPPRGVFTIKKTTGDVLVNKPLDREDIPIYNLIALAKDEDGVAVEDPVDIVIKVIDQNDNRPKFTLSTFYGNVSEGAATGTKVMTVTATDDDQQGNQNALIAYSILNQDPNMPSANMFTISSSTGLITVQNSGLDRESVNQYTLDIQAADLEGQGMATKAKAIITILDANDNVPQFVTKEVTVEVPENEVDYDVTRLAVTDEDARGEPAWKAVYRIVFGNDREQFSVTTDSENNGVLKIIKPLDYEKNKKHEVIIEVKNEIELTSGMPLSSATVTILVSDANEAPIFNPNEKVEEKPENLPKGSTVTTYTAKDPDTAQMQIIRYRMGSDPAEWFAVDLETGMIKLKSEMDRESVYVKNSTYMATILAYDDGTPPATGTGTLLVKLEDINDNPPIATAPLNHVCNHNPLPINVTIIDKDIEPNTFPYVVTLVHGAAYNWTIKNTEYADVKMLLLKKEVEPGMYEVPLKVTDSGHPSLPQVTGLQVQVCDCYDSGACKERMIGASFGISGILAILGAILALLILVLLLLLFVKKRQKVKKEPLLPEEDVRDNIYYYDEEGGGEEDQDYDLSQIHRGLDARPEVVRNDVAPLHTAPQYRPRPANPDEIGNFIDENLKTADNDPTAPPYDSLLVFDYEGGGSEADSLSSLNSSTNSDLDQDYDHLNNWGPRFKKLAEMYGGGEE
ncbi:B-cadherin [Mustelus asterias]